MNNVISEAVSGIDPRYVEEAADHRHRPLWLRWVCAACLALLLGFGAFAHFTAQPENLATITYGDEGIPATFSTFNKSLLAHLTEEELFSRENMYAFRGRVLELQNVTIDFGSHQIYRCVAVLQVDKVYQGDLQEGQHLRMLLPCPILADMWMEDTGIISRLRVGMEGIFMPTVYDESACISANGKVLSLTDLAPCGLPDGTRWVFLKTDRGLVYCKSCYRPRSTLITLDGAESYVLRKLNEVKEAEES